MVAHFSLLLLGNHLEVGYYVMKRPFDINYWIQEYIELRKDHMEGFFHVDELREMLRRMGYIIKIHQDQSVTYEQI